MLQTMNYPGGKSGAGVYQTLINLMPPHDVYVEPFLGGGAVMRLKRPAAVNVGIDRDRTALEMALLPAGSYRRPLVPSLPAVPAAGNGEPRRRRSPFQAVADPIDFSAGAGQRSLLCEGDGIEFLRSTRLPPSTLVYCDPPYLRSTRATRRDLYRFEMTDTQHCELLAVLKTLKCRVMISGYSSTLYARELKSWNVCAFQAATRGKPAVEWVWYNYPRPVELHDYRYLGQTFRERERITRQKRRWLARLEKMPTLQRQALLSAIATLGDGVLHSVSSTP